MKKSFFVIILLFMVVYNANLRPIDSPDCQPARVLPLTLLWDQSFYLDDFDRAWSGTLWPQEPYFLRPFNGHKVTFYPVTQSILISPLYIPAAIYIKANQIPLTDPRVNFVVSLTAKFASSLIAALAAAVLFLALSTMIDRSRSVWLALMYGLGSSAWTTSSQSLWQHGPGQLAFATTVWLLVRNREGASRWDLLGAGMAAALAVTNRPPTVVFALAMAIYVVHRYGKAAWPYFLCPPLIAAAWMGFNLHFYGHPVGAQAAAGANLGGIWYKGLAGLLVSPSHGFIIYCPWVIASFWGCWKLWRGPAHPLILRYLAGAMLGQLWLYSCWDCRWGGGCFGPRIGSDIFPILVFLLVPLVDELWSRKWLKGLFLISVVYSVAVQAAGSFLVLPPSGVRENQWNWRDAQLLIMARQPIMEKPLFWKNAPGFQTVDQLLSVWRGAPKTLVDNSQQIEVKSAPPTVQPGERFTLQVLCQNTGSQVWYDEDNSLGAYLVGLSISWQNVDGAAVHNSITVIPHSVGPGQSITLPPSLVAPLQKGSYRLVASMFSNQGLFTEHGAQPLIVPIQVGIANLLASIDVGSPEGRPHLISGFSGDENAPQLNFAWSVGRESAVSINVDRDGPAQLIMNGFCLPQLKSVDVTVLVNDQEAGVVQVDPRLADYSLVLNKPLRAGENRLSFRYSKTGVPAQLQPGSEDQRELSICWDTIRLEAAP